MTTREKALAYLDSIPSGPWLPPGKLVALVADRFGFGRLWAHSVVREWVKEHSKVEAPR